MKKYIPFFFVVALLAGEKDLELGLSDVNKSVATIKELIDAHDFQGVTGLVNTMESGKLRSLLLDACIDDKKVPEYAKTVYESIQMQTTPNRYRKQIIACAGVGTFSFLGALAAPLDTISPAIVQSAFLITWVASWGSGLGLALYQSYQHDMNQVKAQKILNHLNVFKKSFNSSQLP